ncbi:hypothetical protein MMC12_002753 [Toensbergia leucococca]|nr:hypothetical protein [Toensbergia leucococca]
MTSALPLRRPGLWQDDSSSSSLDGMERVLPKVPRKSFTIFQDQVDQDFNKPLPPTPRKTSSVYSMDADQRGPKDEILLPQILLPPAIHRSTTSKAPDAISTRPKLAPDTQEHAMSDSMIERKREYPRKSGKPRVRFNQDPRIDSQTLISTPGGTDMRSRKLIDQHKNATQRAEDYRSILPAQSSMAPVLSLGPYFADHNYPPTPLSSRITDVVDDSLMPSPLRISTVAESERVSSSFSSRSSIAESVRKGVKDSMRAFVRKALHRPRSSIDKAETKHILSPTASRRLSQISSSISRRQSQFGSIASERRSSIQHGFSNMYDTLVNRASEAAKPKPTVDVEGTKRTPIPRELRSPAIPITPYQQLGRKAWEISPKSPKSVKSPKSPKDYFSFIPRSKESIGTTISSWEQKAESTTTPAIRDSKKHASKNADAEKRREELKKKIIVVGRTDAQWV